MGRGRKAGLLMRRPHPLTSLAAGGPDGRALAVAKLGAVLRACGGNVRACAAALVPPVTRQQVHRWVAAWGMRDKKKDLDD